MAGFGEYGRNGIQELIEQPVFEICEASAHIAINNRPHLLGNNHAAAIGTGDRRVPASCGSVGPLRIRPGGRYKHRASRPRPRGVDRCNRGRGARRALEVDKAEVICIEYAGMAGLQVGSPHRLSVPAIDGVGAAVRLAEAVIGLGVHTSKVSTYATPDTRRIPAWPLSRAMSPRRHSSG